VYHEASAHHVGRDGSCASRLVTERRVPARDVALGDDSRLERAKLVRPWLDRRLPMCGPTTQGADAAPNPTQPEPVHTRA